MKRKARGQSKCNYLRFVLLKLVSLTTLEELSWGGYKKGCEKFRGSFHHIVIDGKYLIYIYDIAKKKKLLCRIVRHIYVIKNSKMVIIYISLIEYL